MVMVSMQGRTQESICIMYTLQGKSHLSISYLGIVRPQSQFPHSCVCERFIYSQDRSIYFPAAEYADQNLEIYNYLTDIGRETEHYNSVLEMMKRKIKILI